MGLFSLLKKVFVFLCVEETPCHTELEKDFPHEHILLPFKFFFFLNTMLTRVSHI